MKRSRNNLALNSALLVIPMVCLLNVASCSTNEGAMNSDRQADVVAGYGEQNFNENFGLGLKLPLAEDQFVSILRSKNLEFKIVSSQNGGVPAPRHRQNSDESQFTRMYEIYGGVDIDKGIGKRFRAYVDSRGYVIYIENAFSYPSR